MAVVKMYFVEDEHFARRLQNEFQAYENFKHQKENKEKENLNPVDSKLEYIDPTPSIHDLFVKFDKKFFWNTLGMVEVVWSNKMTKCAGVCSFEGGRGLCKIALSAPLLSLRPRKDLVETLLHEMIHAYLFVTYNNKDREDHGPEFHKHMFRINKEAGTKITVYHTFFDEVEYYQRYVWRCDGPCQKKKPYFGFLRRAINRPPGPNDSWWNEHKNVCGGTFIKISEPEKKPKKSKKIIIMKTKDKHKDIRDYFSQVKTSQTNIESKKTSNIKTLADFKDKIVTGMKTNAGTGTLVVTNIKKQQNSKTKNPKSQNSTKVSAKNKNSFPTTKVSGKVKILNAEQSNSSQITDLKEKHERPKDSEEGDKVKETVRNIWANKFTNSKPQGVSSPKKIKLQCPVCDKGFSEEEIQNHIDECLQMKSNIKRESKSLEGETLACRKPDEYKDCPVCNKKILQSEMNDHLESCLNCSFVNEEGNGPNEIMCESVPCPCCYKWFQESDMNNHIDECLTLNTLKEEILAL